MHRRIPVGAIAVAVAFLLWSFGPLAAQQPAETADQHWVATWATAQTLARTGGGARGAAPPAGRGQATPPTAAVTAAPAPAASPFPSRRFPVPPALSGVSNQTIRMVVRTSIAGRRLRVRFVNAFGAGTVAIGAATLARSNGDSSIDPTTSRVLTFSGHPSTTMYAGQVLVSDAIDLEAPALTDLAVSLYVRGDPGAPTEHRFALRTTYISEAGDFTAAPAIAMPARTTESWYWLAGIDVLAPAAAGVIVTFGDSITDGDQSTHGTNGAWPSILARRLQANPLTSHLAVVNAGISGNRVLGDNTSGVVRIGPDALEQPGVQWITILEGINDITGATRPGAGASALTADDLTRAYRQIVDRAHARGIKVAGCTITPYGGSSVYSEAGEAMRQAVNLWIRTSGTFDAVIDFDAATRDPRDPTRMRPEADSPDMLHPGDAGYRLMAEAIDLAMLATRRAPVMAR
jgi:lysophospholipase L1-like esterase